MSRTTVRVTLSVYADDVEAMKADAAREGLPLSAYVRRLWLAARPREVMAGAWEYRDGDVWVRNGAAWARADRYGWQAGDDGRGRGYGHGYAGGLSAHRDAADAWLRSRGVVLA